MDIHCSVPFFISALDPSVKVVFSAIDLLPPVEVKKVFCKTSYLSTAPAEVKKVFNNESNDC